MRLEQEVMSLFIMEDFSDVPTQTKITKQVESNNLSYVEFESTFQDFNYKNRNKNRYNGDMMVQAFKAEHIQELLSRKSFGVEAGHPLNVTTERALTIDPKNVCCLITDLDVNRDRARGKAMTIDDGGGVGTKMTRMLLQGLEPAFSLRTLANMKVSPDGIRDLVSPPHIVCYDWVFVPSHKNAYIDMNKPVQLVDKNPYTGVKNTTSLIKPITESTMKQIKDMVVMESANIKLFESVFRIASNGLIMSDDFKYAIVKEGSSTVYVPLEKKIQTDITSFLSRL